jgi:hypothetical protein
VSNCTRSWPPVRRAVAYGPYPIREVLQVKTCCAFVTQALA